MAEFSSLIVDKLPQLRRYAAMLTRDRHAVEDLVQETVLRALSHEAHYKPDTNIGAWLATILRNEYISKCRRSGRREGTLPIDPDAAVFATGSPQLDTLAWRDLERGLAELPDDQRDAVLLVGLEGMNYAAAKLDVPVGTVRSRVSRGREALRVLTSGHRLPGRDARRRAPRRFSAEGYLRAAQSGARDRLTVSQGGRSRR